MEDPVTKLSFKDIKLNASEFQIINSSDNRDICIEQVAQENRKSSAKSRSDTVSIELLLIFLNFSFLAVNFLSILKGLPLSYFKDLQDDKNLIFKSFDDLKNSILILSEIIKNINFNKKKCFNWLLLDILHQRI